jgi:hypothetical protein
MSCEDVCPEDSHDRVKISCEDMCPEGSHDRVKMSTSLVATSHPHASPTPIRHPSSYSLSACLSPLLLICPVATSPSQAFPTPTCQVSSFLPSANLPRLPPLILSLTRIQSVNSDKTLEVPSCCRHTAIDN